nr:MAG TPA: hypothetical protein [Caudoviricetes sp.]
MEKEYSHIEIVGGVVSSATITDANGTREEPGMVGKHRYFVDVVDKGGFRIGMWDGESHAEAREEADILRHDFKVVQILDLTVGILQ